MSRRDGIENLLGGSQAQVAPTATALREQVANESAPAPSGVGRPITPSSETSKTAGAKHQKQAKERSSEKTHPTIRFQVSAPNGSEVEQALIDALEGIPEPLRAGVNIGTLFRTVLTDNDAAIAAMIRNQLSKG